MSSCWLLAVLLAISCHAGNDILKLNDCKPDDNALTQFLSLCIKNPAHLEQVQQKLEDGEIDYNALFQLSEDDIRATLKYIDIKPLYIGLIISKLHNIKGSGVEKYPSHSVASIVVLNNEQNKYILQLNQNIANVKNNIAKLEQNMIEINEAAQNITLQINDHYQELYKILSTQKALTLSKLNGIKERKLNMTADQKINATKALKYLQNDSMDLSQIINNANLDLVEKQYGITKLIDTSQQELLKYDYYLQQNMVLITQPVFKYSTKETFLFVQFVQKINNIFDVDINLTDIRFDGWSIFIDWSTDLFYLDKDLKFDVEFNKVGANKTTIKEWKVVHCLSANETEIELDPDKMELLEEFTEYEFRIKVIFLNHEIYSQTLNCETKELTAFSSILLTDNEKTQLVQWIPNGMDRKFLLLFRASRDGFAAASFHQKCDDKGETLVIVKSEMNHIFGGYTKQSWTSNGEYKEDENAWIYLLRSSRNDLTQKWSCQQPHYAIRTESSVGPIFGGGHDFHLSDRCNENSQSYSGFGFSYSASEDHNKLAGSYKFKCIDYEVWELI